MNETLKRLIDLNCDLDFHLKANYKVSITQSIVLENIKVLDLFFFFSLTFHSLLLCSCFGLVYIL